MFPLNYVMTPNIKKSKIWARYTNSILIWVEKYIWVEEILLLEVWAMAVSSEVLGAGSYPVNKYTHIYILHKTYIVLYILNVNPV